MGIAPYFLAKICRNIHYIFAKHAFWNDLEQKQSWHKIKGCHSKLVPNQKFGTSFGQVDRLTKFGLTACAEVSNKFTLE